MRIATLKNWKAALFLAVIAASVSPALALVSQDDVFRSLTQNMDSEPDYGKLLPWLFAIAGLIAVIIYIRQRQKRQAVPKALNHPGKLVREVVRLADLDPDELKELKLLAQQCDCQSPLTLLLCPSLRNSGETKQQTEESPAQ